VDPIALWLFVPVWVGALALARGLRRRLIGVTTFFTAVSVLYILLPIFFYSGDAPLFLALVAGSGLAIVGFWLGFTGPTGFREPVAEVVADRPLETTRLGHTAVVLMTIGLLSVAIANPNVLSQVGTYEGRVAFQSGRGIEPFLLNQVVVGLGAVVLLALERRWWMVALLASIAGVGWAVYSSHKLSMLTTLAAWFAWWIAGVWHGQRSVRLAWLGIALLPLILPMLLVYSFLRAGSPGDLSDAVALAVNNLDRLGDAGVMVGDFDGPYRVLIATLENRASDVVLGWTYVSQLAVLMPRGFRGDFLDLAEEFARLQLGSAWQPGMGLAFSPWAEGVLNFGLFGFFVEAFLFGLILSALVRSGRAAFGRDGALLLYCLAPQIVLFQRGYLVGVVKNVVVYALPLVCVWLALGWLGRIASSTPIPIDSRRFARDTLAD
jgi:hypothetical protein